MPAQTDPPGADWAFPPIVPAADELPAPEAGEPGPAPSAPPPSAGVLPVPRRSPASAGPVSPLRALAGAGVAVAGVLLGIGALLWATEAPTGTPALQRPASQRADTAASTPSPGSAADNVMVTPAPLQSRAAPGPVPAPKLALTVLNNSNVDGLAARSAAKFRAAGWPIKLTGSFRGRIPVTTVYYAPGQRASAVLLQQQFPAIERVRPRFATLPGSGLTVVLTRTYPG